MILFTAFEPSGDALAAALIQSLREARPELEIFALGGPRMEAAGAQLIESTTEEAKMTASAISEVAAHRKRLARLGQWLKAHPIDALVPTDSPAANWSVCSAVRKARPEARIVHLVCPQIWAWAPWRVRRLQRLSDHVMCLLPFEPAWLGKHGVPATFVGHPLFEPRDSKSEIQSAHGQSEHGEGEGADVAGQDGHPLGGGGLPRVAGPKLALLPGSRKQEIVSNWPTMWRVFARLRDDLPGLTAVVGARQASDESALARASPHWPLPAEISVRYDMTDQAIEWADAVLAVSGTVSLQVAAHHKPLVVVYRVNRLLWSTLGRWLVDTRTFSLPNLIGQSMHIGAMVPEFVPHFGQIEPIAEALEPLLRGGEARQAQLAGFDQIIKRFEHMSFKQATVKTLLRVGEL